MPTTEESRSSQSMGNLQELLDSGHTSDASLEQYFTPPELVRDCTHLLPIANAATVFDPQCGSGALLQNMGWGCLKFGVELDHTKSPQGVQLINANCMKVFEAVEDLMPDLRFVVANCNPPFGRKWKLANGDTIDSTLATWHFVTRHAKCGYFISNANTIEKFGIHQDATVEVTSYQRKPANDYWHGLRDGLEIGIVHWKVKDFANATFTPPGVALAFWNKLNDIIEEEKSQRPPYNIWLDSKGFLRTYLSIRQQHKIDTGKP